MCVCDGLMRERKKKKRSSREAKRPKLQPKRKEGSWGGEKQDIRPLSFNAGRLARKKEV